MIKLEIGKNLKKYRKASNMTQTEVGDILGVSYRTISSWESDRTEPSIGVIERLAQIYGCQKSDLVKTQQSIPDIPSGTGELLDLYSRATPDQRKAVINLLRSFVADH